MTPQDADDQLAEWLVRWEEAVLANQLPAELRPHAREACGC